jgi:flap endonuclease GEN
VKCCAYIENENGGGTANARRPIRSTTAVNFKSKTKRSLLFNHHHRYRHRHRIVIVIMTVSSLWKTLNKANCGKAVGEKELASGQTADLRNVNPWNVNEHRSNKKQTLAVDLSIWICESLTSQGMVEQNANPTLNLVFSRTVRLLNQGIKLIFVVEGKSRIRTEMGDDDLFRKRRSGTSFWKACNDCQKMLELLGVPVVRAKAEGEALCALLSQRGIVDGVISNDGDCLLFGAKTVYTKFSIENLDNGNVIRYDLEDLRAVVEKSDDDDEEGRAGTESNQELKLSRQDLVVFALLTGSDMAGSGLAKVGHKKAIRFIRKCQKDNPLSTETAALDEMRAWANAARAEGIQVHVPEDEEDEQGGVKKKSEACCSRCCHGGTKRNHHKHGCEICGTEPGETCFKVTSDDRFRKSLRAKALAMQPRFEPSKVLAAYMSPNNNQIPLQLATLSSSGIQMAAPQLSGLVQMNLIVKGHSLGSSRTYVQQAVGRLLARVELLRPNESCPVAHDPQEQGLSKRPPRDRPVPKSIQASLVQKGEACYQVVWFVNATVTDENGEGIDGYEYVTVEPCELIEQRYPQLVSAFQEAEVERKKQGDGEKTRRQEFLESFLLPAAENGNNDQNHKKRKAHEKARGGFFQQKVPQCHPSKRSNVAGSEDISHLLRFVPNNANKSVVKTSPLRQKGSMDELSPLNCGSANDEWVAMKPKCENVAKKRVPKPHPDGLPLLTPSKELFCNMGELLIPLTPIDSNQGVFPPRHIFVVVQK